MTSGASFPQPSAALAALLDIVGPVEGPRLLKQLSVDLAQCDAAITAALPDRDWKALRRASHNLTALAGTAGAEGLQHMAEMLNHAAHAADYATVQNLAPRIGTELAALTAMIATLAAERGKR